VELLPSCTLNTVGCLKAVWQKGHEE